MNPAVIKKALRAVKNDVQTPLSQKTKVKKQKEVRLFPETNQTSSAFLPITGDVKGELFFFVSLILVGTLITILFFQLNTKRV
jgi:hypothetical protein